MTHTSDQIERWVADLLNEAQRDVVFLFSILRGGMGGLQIAPDTETLEKVIAGLVINGCVVGFANPNLSGWRVPSELQVPPGQLASAIISLWGADRDEGKFIAFALPRSLPAKR